MARKGEMNMTAQTLENPVSEIIDQAIALIDSTTSEIGQKGRNLVDSAMVVDLLLDLRLNFSKLRS